MLTGISLSYCTKTRDRQTREATERPDVCCFLKLGDGGIMPFVFVDGGGCSGGSSREIFETEREASLL
jgi:hypothetical protein